MPKKLYEDPEMKLYFKSIFEHYKLDVLRSKKVLFVKGISEAFLVPMLVEQVMGIDLSKRGIRVIALHSEDFRVFVDLINKEKKRCAVLYDEADYLNDSPESFNSDYLQVFALKKTFAQSLAIRGLMRMLTETVRGFNKQDKRLTKITYLPAMNNIGKMDFFGRAMKHVDLAKDLPKPIKDAVAWFTQKKTKK